MHRRALLDQLAAYAAQWPAEAAVAERIRALAQAHADCFERTCLPGHVTASAWVVTPCRSLSALVHHRRLDRWLQPGGHADGQSDVAAAALREACEETGLADLRLVDPRPLDLDVHLIPERLDAAGRVVEPAHQHHDVRFLVEATGNLTLAVSDESHDVRWFDERALHAVTTEESVLRLWRKACGPGRGA